MHRHAPPAHSQLLTGTRAHRFLGCKAFKSSKQPKQQKQQKSLSEGGRQRAQASRQGLGAVFQAAKGASSVAASAWQSLLDKQPSLPSLSPLQLPVPGLLTQWFPPDTQGSDNAAARQAASQRRAADKARRAEDRERAALQLLQQQADANEAVQLLRRRARAGSLPGERRDGFKLGLVVEGGGMRGAVSGGGLQALHDLGLRDCFDTVYGSSAGAINATYFLSGQREGVDIYSQDIANTAFCDMRRLLQKKGTEQRPALDLSYLLDYVMMEVKPLNWQAIIDSPIPLKVVASCLNTLQPILLEGFRSVHDLRECLRASATVPAVAGEPVSHRDRLLVDAAVFEAIPFRAAIADGCTHVIALATRPPFRKDDLFGKLIDEGVSGVIKRAVLSPEYMKPAWVREAEFQKAWGVSAEELLAQALDPSAHLLPAMAGTHVFPVFPGSAASYSPVCIDAATIMLGIAEGRSAVLKVFGSSGPLQLPAKTTQPQVQPELAAAAAKPAPVLASVRRC